MSFSYDRYERQQRGRTSQSNRSGLGYWLPLALSVTVATVGFAAWIWNERRESGDSSAEESDDYYYERREKGKRRAQLSPQRDSSSYTPPGVPPTREDDIGFEESSRVQESNQFQEKDIRQQDDVEQESIVTRLNDAIRRTPSPQQLFDGASKRVAAGVAAAGAAVGRGFTAITETNDDYLEHNRWEEEAETRARNNATTSPGQDIGSTVASAISSATSQVRRAIGQRQPKKKGRLVVIVVSAASDHDHSEDSMAIDHASILSHLPTDINSDTVELLVLIYAPHLKVHPLSSAGGGTPSMRKSSSMGSFSAISTPGEDSDELGQASASSSAYDPNPPSALYNALQSRAATLTAHPTHILPFTTPNGHVHLLKHLSPSLVYMQESLCGDKGEIVAQISGWVGQIVVVVGAEGLGGGIVDTETEAETEDESSGVKKGRLSSKYDKWWMDDSRVGLGKGVEVVESMRIEEDWAKRVEN